MFLRPSIFFTLLLLALTACASAPAPRATTPPASNVDSRLAQRPDVANPAGTTTAPPSLSAFEGTWQHGQPCRNNYRWMQLRENDDAVVGRWAASMDLWGLMTGDVRATPGDDHLRTETCVETFDLPHYAAFFSACPKFAAHEGERGLRLDEATGELLLVSSIEGRVISRMKRVDAASEPSAFCANVEE